ncbi:type 1 glutamine amidotransferase [Geodermatophilus sabuli]|uniref:GMP synthase - Glutamine amidotransferase n=1 Tax=Geodermatophilus sabuli TaxID=1564158 RepID=A0A285EG12_9ACTN|nr:type 1 glutamine amidotransferase [Geodermatophilus sabuli]MBB3084663.1 GMP synthase-like glutamine amidotransferase [Geodermatophilus sabuli]SNX97144.1 GMP synthase - Glutamine amidotransferase [Geodermatophilus sabuli]
MSIAVLSHVREPSVTVLRDRAAAVGRELTVYAAYRGDFPDPGEHEAWVVLGGPQSVDADRAALQPEIDVLTAAIEHDVPMLAICLGAQLLAVATGGRAFAGLHGLESGLVEVCSTTAQPPSGRYYSFHSDSMEPPPGAELLAKSDRYLQAWRHRTALAVQFHPELDAAGFAALLDGEEEKLRRFGVDVPALREEAAIPQCLPTAGERLIDTWLAGLPARR